MRDQCSPWLDCCCCRFSSYNAWEKEGKRADDINVGWVGEWVWVKNGKTPAHCQCSVASQAGDQLRLRQGGREGGTQATMQLFCLASRPPPPPVLPSLRSLFGGSTPVQLSSWLSDERSKENAVRSLTHSAIHPSIPACGWVVGSRYRSASHTLTKGKKRRILRPTLSYIRTCPASRYPTYILHGQLARCVGRF